MTKTDWRKKEDYAYTDDLDKQGWAWEFLRRNPEYRKDYESLQSGEFKEVTYEPKKKSEETEEQWKARCILNEDVDPRKIGSEQTLARKWRLKFRLYDPSMNALELREAGTAVEFTDVELTIIKKFDDVYSIPTEETSAKMGDEVDVDSVTMIRKDQLLVVFDVTGPLKPQLDTVRRSFNQAKDEMPPSGAKNDPIGKPKKDVFLNGIRALDGIAAEASNHEIGIVLFADAVANTNIDVKIHDCIKSAINNMKFGYRAIAIRRTPLHKT
tara:strand:- start:722 stop:1528 length:807 start_codon:yes stop_codon:yes gene_type:complete